MTRHILLAVVVVSVGLGGCSSGENKDCTSHAYVLCTGGSLYWMNSCDEFEQLIMTCSKGCAPDQKSCQGEPPPCSEPADCPPGLGCLEGGRCGACTADEQCRSGERCLNAICQVPCEQGPCCGPNGGYLSEENVCSETTEYRCRGNACGDDPQTRTIKQYCSGVSASCDGRIEEGSWQSSGNCNSNQLCRIGPDGAYCESCEAMCQDGRCIGCTDEPCCADGKPAPRSTECDRFEEYRCKDAACGGTVQMRVGVVYCTGSSIYCDGTPQYTSWVDQQTCDSDALCVESDGSASCQQCGAGCSGDTCLEPCTSGPCCQDGVLADSTVSCDSWTEKRCTGTDCGADVEVRQATQYCSGATPECDGEVVYTDWTVETDCDANSLCVEDAAGAACQACELGCSGGACNTCTDEPCCDNGSPRPSSFVCASWTEYRCNGTGCGADAQERVVNQYCDGSSFLCTGVQVPEAWRTIEVCHPDDICLTDDTTYAECQNCPAGCTDGQCN